MFCFQKQYVFKRVIHLHHKIVVRKKVLTITWHYFPSLRITVHCHLLTAGHLSISCFTVYYSFEHILLFEAKRFIFVTPETSQNYFLQHQKRWPELCSQDAVGEKSLLMHDTDGEDVIQLHVKKPKLSL